MNLQKKLNKICIIGIGSYYNFKKVMYKVESLFNQTNFTQLSEDERKVLYNNKKLNSDENNLNPKNIICFNITSECFSNNSFELIENNEAKKYKEVSIDDFMYIEQSKLYRKLMSLSKTSMWEDLSDLQNEIDKLHKSNKTMSSEESEILFTIQQLINVNTPINQYNKRIADIEKSNLHAIECKKLIYELTDEDFFGIIEIETVNGTEEIQLQLFQETIGYIEFKNSRFFIEGPCVYADTSLQHIKHTNTSSYDKISHDLDHIVDHCREIESVYEIGCESFNMKDNQYYQQFMSVDGFKEALLKQAWKIEQNADKIYGGLYKLLMIIKHDILVEKEL